MIRKIFSGFCFLLIISCNNGSTESTQVINDSVAANKTDNTQVEIHSGNDTAKAAVMFRGKEFQATGNEPFWLLKIQRDSLLFKLIDGYEYHEPLTVPVFNNNDSVKYIVQAEEGMLTLIVYNKECIDGMSGFKSPYTTEIYFTGPDNTQAYHGCGDHLEAFNQRRE